MNVERTLIGGIWGFLLFGALWRVLGLFESWTPLCTQMGIAWGALFLLCVRVRHRPESAVRIVLWAAVVVSGGFLLEVIGTGTGFLFGSYRYGAALGPGMLHVPYVMGLSWLLTMLCAQDIACRFTGSPAARAAVGAAAVVALDVPLEQAAPRLDYWHWQTGSPPLFNFVCWAIAGVAILVAYEVCVRERPSETESRIGTHAYSAQVVFFAVVGAFG